MKPMQAGHVMVNLWSATPSIQNVTNVFGTLTPREAVP
jgi:hypothetical protein